MPARPPTPRELAAVGYTLGVIDQNLAVFYDGLDDGDPNYVLFEIDALIIVEALKLFRKEVERGSVDIFPDSLNAINRVPTTVGEE